MPLALCAVPALTQPLFYLPSYLQVPSKAAKVAVAEQAAPVSLGAMLGGYSDSGSASD